MASKQESRDPHVAAGDPRDNGMTAPASPNGASQDIGDDTAATAAGDTTTQFDYAFADGPTGVFRHVAKVIPYFRNPRHVLVFKLDVMLLAWMFLAGIMKEMDQSATTQAYVSGMREALSLYGNELVEFNTYFSIGYAIGLIPGQLIQTRVRPSLYLPICEITWGMLVLFTYMAPNAKTIFALRFFLGLLAASFWPSVVALIFNWYTPRELAFRLACFNVSDVAGGMFLGALQAALYRDMDGVHGKAGWQWLFIIAGAVTVGQGLLAFISIPDSPAITRALWLTDDEKQLARRRMDAFGATTSKMIPASVLRRKLVRIVGSPITYMFLVSFAFSAWAHRANSYFVLYLESILDASGRRVYSTYQVNVLPLGGYALQIVSSVALNALSDWKRWRFQISVGSTAVSAVFLAVLAGWPADRHVVMAFYFLTYATNAGNPSLMAWMAELLRREPEARAVIVALTVTVVYVGHATIPLGVWRVQDAPRYPIGFPLAVAMCVCSVGSQLLLKMWERRHPEVVERGFAKPGEAVVEASDEESSSASGSAVGSADKRGSNPQESVTETQDKGLGVRDTDGVRR